MQLIGRAPCTVLETNLLSKHGFEFHHGVKPASLHLESTIFVMNTYVNVAFLRLLLSAEQLAKSDQHLEEELMFCAQANPLSQ